MGTGTNYETRQREILGHFWVLGLDRWQRDSGPRMEGPERGKKGESQTIVVVQSLLLQTKNTFPV